MNRAREILEQLPRTIRDAAGCMIIAGDRVLLLQRDANAYHEPFKWGIPGGRLEPNETPWQAAVRETLEEANIDLSKYTPERNIQQFTPNEGKVFTTFVYRFRSRFVENNLVEIDHESEDWGWFTRDETDALDLHIGVEKLMDIVHF